MNNFKFYNPTIIEFGEGKIAKIDELIPKNAKLMLTFGGGSVKKNGTYEQVKEALSGRKYIEFWGIEPNPAIETLRKAIDLGKKNEIDFILAVGGGSVIDGTKLITAGICYEGDAWELVKKGYARKSIPFGTILTIPATGSEMNSGAVISCQETKEKYPFYSKFPVFSILDPKLTFSLPERQVAYGIADIFVHVMEQYLTVTGESRLMDRWAEGILSTLVEIFPLLKENPKDYDLRAEVMLCATMALNGFIALGVSQDWATHMIGHELTAICGLAHGATLAIIFPATMRVLCKQKGAKIIQYGKRIWGLSGEEHEIIDIAIKKTEEFFRSLGLNTRLSEVHIGEDTIQEITRRFEDRKVAFGEAKNVDASMTLQILHTCK